MNMHITQFYCIFINIMFLVEFICHQKCSSWRKLHFSACCTNDIFVDIFQNMVNIYYSGWFFVSFKSPLLFLVLLCCITRESSAKNEFCCVSNKNFCKTRKRPRSSAIAGQRTQFSHLLLFGVWRFLLLFGVHLTYLRKYKTIVFELQFFQELRVLFSL